MLLLDTLSIAQDTLTLAQESMTLLADSANVDTVFNSAQTLSPVVESSIGEPSWTDKAQAWSAIIGTFAAILAAGLAIKSYLNTIHQQQDQINDQQKQLDALSDIAKGLITQVTQNKERRMLEIRPNITLLKTIDRVQIIRIELKNIGNTASNIRFFSHSDLLITLISTETKETFIGGRLTLPSFSSSEINILHPNEEAQININLQDKMELKTSGYEFWMYYNDKDHNEYALLVKYNTDEGNHISYLPTFLGNYNEWYDENSERSKTYREVKYQILGKSVESLNNDIPS